MFRKKEDTLEKHPSMMNPAPATAAEVSEPMKAGAYGQMPNDTAALLRKPPVSGVIRPAKPATPTQQTMQQPMQRFDRMPRPAPMMPQQHQTMHENFSQSQPQPQQAPMQQSRPMPMQGYEQPRTQDAVQQSTPRAPIGYEPSNTATHHTPVQFTQTQTQQQSFSAAASANANAASSTEKRVLTVGHDTVLKGEITTCDRLIVQGTVDAVLSDVHTIEIAERGIFKGSATVDNAEISGRFDGDLEVHGRLTIFATGRVTGKVSYAELEVHRGGKMSGKVQLAGSAGDTEEAPALREATFSA
jgi:cytoskeletal protein CcmA (bactofilin family)